MYSWDDIRLFVAVAHSGSLSAAARQLNMQNATISRRIAALEEQCGGPLFLRHRTGLVITELGDRIMARAEEMAAAAQGIDNEIAARDKTLSGLVRVSATEGMAGYWLLPRLSKFKEANPSISVEVDFQNTSVDLIRRAADIAIRLKRPDEEGLIARLVGRLEMGLFASADLVRRRGLPTSVNELEPLGLVDYTWADPTGTEGWRDIIIRSGNNATRVNSALGQVEAVRSGLGVSLIPRYVGQRFNLIPIVPDFSWRTREIWLVAHNDLKSVPWIRRVYDFLVDELDASFRSTRV
ncbi:LysR family transcriptional regulator [Lacibacterium aquatile]|uniref:LysR family transcriptional regulator n=1 Tax=Lacibacterium aquatile TaxID=1168082 RepID=A0ABW5DSF5_9PROT